MRINSKVKRYIRYQSMLFIVLFVSVVSMIAWFSTQFEIVSDWTSNKRNTASVATISLLKTIESQIIFTAFVTDENTELRQEIEYLISLYKNQKENVQNLFVDPVTEPKIIRELGISRDGELLIEIAGRKEFVQSLDEETITNTIQKLVRKSNQRIVFLQGHNERSALSHANYDLSTFTEHLKARGLITHSLNLADSLQIPSDAAVLVIADPQKEFLPGELLIVQDYVEQGGNLLWLAEPGALNGLDLLAEQLGIEFLPGIVVDPNTQLLGISDPRFALIPEYPLHPITQNLRSIAVFPIAVGIEFSGIDEWDGESFLDTLPRTWLETDDWDGELKQDSNDIAGPFSVGFALTRAAVLTSLDVEMSASEDVDEEMDDLELVDLPEKNQRIVLIGDSDFLSNAYLGQGDNLDLGLNIINWLTEEDQFIAIPARIRLDASLQLSVNEQKVIAYGFIFILPALLLFVGLATWFKRRRA